MKYITRCVVGSLLSVTPVNAWAAKAPVSAEVLQKEADHIVSGSVTDVTTTTRKSKVEKAMGIHRDRIFRIRLNVESVSKGAAIQAGMQIEIIAWQVEMRIPPLPGLQGHEVIPKKGDTVTVYLQGKEGNAFKPILPNGIAVKQKID